MIFKKLFNKKKILKDESKKQIVDIKSEILKTIKDVHTLNPGTVNCYGNLHPNDWNIRQVKVADGERIKQHFVQVFDEFNIAFISADFTDFENPIFYELKDGGPVLSKAQNIENFLP